MPTPSYPLDYVTDKAGNRVLPITHVEAVRDSDGNTLPEILQRDYPLESKPEEQGSSDLSVVTTGEKYNWNHKLGSSDVDSSIPSTSSSKLPTSDAVKAYVASVMINPISDSSILNNQSFNARDCVNVNGTMYLCDEDTDDYPYENVISDDGDIVVDADGNMIVEDNTMSADWHSF